MGAKFNKVHNRLKMSKLREPSGRQKLNERKRIANQSRKRKIRSKIAKLSRRRNRDA